MRPSQNHGLELQTRTEQVEAQNTLTVAALEFDESIASPETIEVFRELAVKADNHSRAELGNVSLILTEQEKRTLHDAARVAEIHFYISRGILNLLMQQYGISLEAALDMAENSNNTLLQQVKITADVGSSALRLSGLLSLYAEHDKLVND